MEWLERADNEWYTKASETKFFIRWIEDYHELVGGDFYDYIDLSAYAILEWQNPEGPALAVYETLEEARDKLRELLAG